MRAWYYATLCIVTGCVSDQNPNSKYWIVEKIALRGNITMLGGEFGSYCVDVVGVDCTRGRDVVTLLYELPLPDDLKLEVGDRLDFADSLVEKNYDHQWDGYWIRDIIVTKLERTP